MFSVLATDDNQEIYDTNLRLLMDPAHKDTLDLLGCCIKETVDFLKNPVKPVIKFFGDQMNDG